MAISGGHGWVVILAGDPMGGGGGRLIHGMEIGAHL